MARHPDVIFEFVSDDGTSITARGEVIVRDTEMVLQVESHHPDDLPYLVRGQNRDGFYAGSHEGTEGDVPVNATWTRLGDLCEGSWVEDNYNYRFTFRLTAARQSRE